MHPNFNKQSGLSLMEVLIAAAITAMSITAVGVFFFRAQTRMQEGTWKQTANLETKRLLTFIQRQFSARKTTAAVPAGYRLLDTPIAGLYPTLEITRSQMTGGLWATNYVVTPKTSCVTTLANASSAPTEVYQSSCLSCQPGQRAAIVFPDPVSSTIPPATMTFPDTNAFTSYRAVSGAFCITQASSTNLLLQMEIYIWPPGKEELYKIHESLSVTTTAPNADVIMQK